MSGGDFSDDQGIPDEETLYRRIHPLQVKRRPDGTIERIGSNAFRDSSDGSPCSIALASKLVEHGLEPGDLLRGYEHMGLASFTAGQARECGFGLLHTPKDGEPAHGDLTGDKRAQKPRRRLAALARLLQEPQP